MSDIARLTGGCEARRCAILVAVCGLLGACQAPTRVHLFTDIMDEASVESLKGDIRSAGMAASVSSAEIPQGLRHPTIVVPTIVRSQSHIRELQRVMGEAGYQDVRVELYSPGTHSFTPDNIGLYVTDLEAAESRVERGTENLAAPDSSLSRVYFSDCPATDAELNLYENGAVMLEVFNWDESEKREYSTFTGGDWNNEESVVVINLEDSDSLRYTVHRFEREDQSGTYRGIELLGKEEANGYQACDFHFTSRVPARRR
ncbi:MAG: hypothetical protein WEB57_10370 [Pseudohongiellaceae bacterium]